MRLLLGQGRGHVQGNVLRRPQLGRRRGPGDANPAGGGVQPRHRRRPRSPSGQDHHPGGQHHRQVGHEESIRWFREPNRGDWPPRPLSRFREIIETVNRCCDIQERLGALPKAHEGDLCIICGKPAHVRYRGQPNCEDCRVERWGGPTEGWGPTALRGAGCGPASWWCRRSAAG